MEDNNNHGGRDEFEAWLSDHDKEIKEKYDSYVRKQAEERKAGGSRSLSPTPAVPTSEPARKAPAAQPAASDAVTRASGAVSAGRPGFSVTVEEENPGVKYTVPPKVKETTTPIRRQAGASPTGQDIYGPGDVPISRKRAPSQYSYSIPDDPEDNPSRREAVKNFRLEIDEDAIEEDAGNREKPERKDKAIYFASYRPSKQDTENRRKAEQARQQESRKKAVAKQQAEEKIEKKAHRLRMVIAALVVVIFTTAFSYMFITCIDDILAISRSDDLVNVTIEKGATSDQIIDVLADSGLIEHPAFCKKFTQLRGFDSKEYISGVYYISADMGVEGMLNEMLGQQTSDTTTRLYFPEGYTISQIVKKLSDNSVCPDEYLYKALLDGDFDFEFINDIPEDPHRAFRLEGYLFPDTYDFFYTDDQNGMGENPTSVINKMLSNFQDKWTDLYSQRAAELGLTMDQVVIIASIIQKEAANEEQMTQVSSVIHNRLNDSANFPTLGCDSTKIYADTFLADAIGEAKAAQYEDYYDTNGVISGLPAGPICNPGQAAIEAALNPDQTDYYYFCHNNAGKIYLARTYSEFQQDYNQVLRDNAEAE